MDADILYENILSHFTVKKRGEKSSQSLCPCHNDKQASLTISKGDKGVLIRCHAGCDCKDIVQSVGLRMKDLFYDYEPKRTYKKEYNQAERRQYWLEHNYIDVYHYFDIRTDQYSYTKYRMPNKQFPQGIYKDKVWHDGLNGISEENKKLSFFL